MSKYRNINPEELLELPDLYICVYGTLREGQGAHRFISDLKKDISIRLHGYYMFDHGSFPFIVHTQDLGDHQEIAHRVPPALGELYKFPDEFSREQRIDIINSLDAYEGVPALYNRDVIEIPLRDMIPPEEFFDLDEEEQIEIEDGEKKAHVVAYTWAGEIRDSDNVVRVGDWVNHLNHLMRAEQKTKARISQRDDPFREILVGRDGQRFAVNRARRNT